MSSRRSRNGRENDRQHVQAVVQVLPEPAFGNHLSQVALRAPAMIRTFTLMGRPLPTRSMVRFWSTRSSFTWIDGGTSSMSSRNTVPADDVAPRGQVPVTNPGSGYRCHADFNA
jgi:hypothetical protein